MKSRVMRQGAKVSIDGVLELGWGKGKETTYIGALESALSVTDRVYSYEQLMAVSGVAFRVRWWRGADDEGQQFCPSSPVGEFEPEVMRVSDAIGWEQSVDVRFDRPEGQYGFEEDLAHIQASIDDGIPVLCYGKFMDMSVIYGYFSNSDQLLVMDYHGKQGEDTILSASRIGPMMIFFGEKTDPCPTDTWLDRALRTAVEDFESEGFNSQKPGRYYLGSSAIRQWITDLEKWETMKEEHRVEMFHPHWWTFSCLYDARLAATKFLRSESDQLRSVNEIYQKQLQLLGRTFTKRDVFLGPWTGQTIESWDSEVRKNEASILGEFLELEVEAIDKVKDYLAHK